MAESTRQRIEQVQSQTQSTSKGRKGLKGDHRLTRGRCKVNVSVCACVSVCVCVCVCRGSCKQEVMAGVRSTARPEMEARRRVQAGEGEGPLILQPGLELGQVERHHQGSANCTAVLSPFF